MHSDNADNANQYTYMTLNIKNRFPLIVNAISISVAFTMNFPELIALLTQDSHTAAGNSNVIFQNLNWMQVSSEILFTYISILILFFLNEKLFKFKSPNSNINGKKILISFLIIWIANNLLGKSFILMHRYFGLPAIEDMAHVYSHPLRDFIISGIVTLGGYLIHQNLLSRKVMLENQQLKTENIKNQFEALKNQLNPHMLFNSLNTLYSLIRENPDKAQDYLTQLSKVMRYTLHRDDENMSDTIYLKEELDYIKSYIYLLKMRYEENLSFNISIDESLFNRKLPRMALQLLIENAVKHNEISNRHPLTVNISAVTSSTGYSMEVSNRIQLRRGTISSTGIGLSNLSKRYVLLTGKDIEIKEHDGTFSVTVPLI